MGNFRLDPSQFYFEPSKDQVLKISLESMTQSFFTRLPKLKVILHSGAHLPQACLFVAVSKIPLIQFFYYSTPRNWFNGTNFFQQYIRDENTRSRLGLRYYKISSVPHKIQNFQNLSLMLIKATYHAPFWPLFGSTN